MKLEIDSIEDLCELIKNMHIVLLISQCNEIFVNDKQNFMNSIV